MNDIVILIKAGISSFLFLGFIWVVLYPIRLIFNNASYREMENKKRLKKKEEAYVDFLRKLEEDQIEEANYIEEEERWIKQKEEFEAALLPDSSYEVRKQFFNRRFKGYKNSGKSTTLGKEVIKRIKEEKAQNRRLNRLAKPKKE